MDRTKLKSEITQILKDNITFSGQTGSYVVHGAIDKIVDLFEREREKELLIHNALTVLKRIHAMLEIDFESQTEQDKEIISDIVEMSANIRDDYWMYKRDL